MAAHRVQVDGLIRTFCLGVVPSRRGIFVASGSASTQPSRTGWRKCDATASVLVAARHGGSAGGCGRALADPSERGGQCRLKHGRRRIVGVAATIHSIRAPLGEVAAALAFGALTALLMLPRASAWRRTLPSSRTWRATCRTWRQRTRSRGRSSPRPSRLPPVRLPDSAIQLLPQQRQHGRGNLIGTLLRSTSLRTRKGQQRVTLGQLVEQFVGALTDLLQMLFAAKFLFALGLVGHSASPGAGLGIVA